MGRPAPARRAAGSLAVALALALAAAAARPLLAAEVTDMLGRRVRVPERPARVVSLAPSITESVFAVEAGERLVGVTDFCDHPPEARRKPRIGGIYTPSLEAIAARRPDLVLATSESNRDEHVRRLEALGLPVYVVRPVDFATVLESIERVGAVLGRAADAARVVSAMRAEAEAIARAVAGAPRPRVLYVVWGDPLIAPGRDALITELIRRAGGESVTAGERLLYPQLSLEALAERRPEHIIVGRQGEGRGEDELRGWDGLRAALRGVRIQAVDGNLLHRPGPRMVEALRALARAIHPERVP